MLRFGWVKSSAFGRSFLLAGGSALAFVTVKNLLRQVGYYLSLTCFVRVMSAAGPYKLNMLD